MGVYIEGMEMSNSCYDCRLRKRIGMGIHCPIVHTSFRISEPDALFYRMKNCPLITVPPHGRLIDADALLKKCEFACTDDDVDVRVVRCSVIEAAPTIIPAEEGET